MIILASLVRPAAVGAAIAFYASSVWAAPVTETISFSASNFDQAAAPISPVSGSFTLTFDPAAGGGASTGPVTVNSLNIAYTFPVTYQHQTTDRLVIGTGAVGAGHDTFSLQILTSSTKPTFQSLFYSTASSTEVFTTGTGTVSVAAIGVPEPKAVDLLLGMLAVGGLLIGARRFWPWTHPTTP